jgi:membrane associated rhomboid family serine protease
LIEYPDFIKELAKQVESGESGRAEILGQLAFRDFYFQKAAPDMDYRGDQVAFEFWKKRIADVDEYEASHPSFTLGLNAGDTSLNKWISYIFVHSGFMHFFGNMLFLIIFGTVLERQIGGLGLLVVFLLSGMAAAGSFAVMTGVTSSPLVGASGAISGIMALYCVLNWSKPARYFYWFFLPFRGFMGMVYLPAWVAIALWAAGDLAGYLGTVPELGGVAHTAHLGGETAGILTGLILFAMRRWRPVKAIEETPASVIPMGVLIPFLPPKIPKAA